MQEHWSFKVNSRDLFQAFGPFYPSAVWGGGMGDNLLRQKKQSHPTSGVGRELEDGGDNLQRPLSELVTRRIILIQILSPWDTAPGVSHGSLLG